jgi:hypothetical protein
MAAPEIRNTAFRVRASHSEALMAERDPPQSPKGNADGGFLGRWSRRKAEARSAATAAIEEPGGPADRAPASRPQAAELQEGPDAPVDPKDLPDIESLDAGSDFTVFMRPGVPEHLRTLALRKLWRSDPIFSKLDGMVEYGEDYSIASWPKGVIKTAYKVGRGFLEEISEGRERPDQAPPTELPPEPAIAPAEEPADEQARIAAAPAEALPPAPAALQEPDSPQERPARPATKRRRGLAARSRRHP